MYKRLYLRWGICCSWCSKAAYNRHGNQRDVLFYNGSCPFVSVLCSFSNLSGLRPLCASTCRQVHLGEGHNVRWILFVDLVTMRDSLYWTQVQQQKLYERTSCNLHMECSYCCICSTLCNVLKIWFKQHKRASVWFDIAFRKGISSRCCDVLWPFETFVSRLWRGHCYAAKCNNRCKLLDYRKI